MLKFLIVLGLALTLTGPVWAEEKKLSEAFVARLESALKDKRVLELEMHLVRERIERLAIETEFLKDRFEAAKPRLEELNRRIEKLVEEQAKKDDIDPKKFRPELGRNVWRNTETK